MGYVDRLMIDYFVLFIDFFANAFFNILIIRII